MIAAAGMERFVRIKTASNLWFLGDRPRPIWFVLEGPPLGPRSPLKTGWISLDFLGFSRQNRALSRAYTGISLEFFSWSSVIGAAASPSAGWRLSTRRLILSRSRSRSTGP